jgi:hypothetical protein
MKTPRFFQAFYFHAEAESVPKIWTLAGLGQMEYARLPMDDKFELMKKFKPHWVIAWWKAPFMKWRQSYLIWKNRPKGGYLFAAWCRHNAEDFTIKNNYPHASLSCGHTPRPQPERRD